jgi:lysophospholipid acyltransferase (LPLAT)-like uncharacterized protein
VLINSSRNITLTGTGLILQTRFDRMNKSPKKTNFDDVESRRGMVGRRRMSGGRKLYYFLGMPVLLGLLRLFWWSYRVQTVIGADIVERVLANDKVYAPCYWHQHTVLCLNMMRNWIHRGFRAGFVVTPSVDGEVPARIARSWGAEVIRGSAKRTGALAMRDIHAVMKKGVSIVTAADGPLGPKAEFKAGVVLMARIGSAEMIPIACAADRAWYLNRWDDFMIPKPFARVVLAVGEPQVIPAGSSMEDLETHRKNMEDAVKSLTERSEKALAAAKG